MKQSLARFTCTTLAALVCGPAASLALPEEPAPDIERRCVELRDRALAEGASALLAAAASARYPGPALAEALRETGLQPGDTLLILSGEGAPRFSLPPGAGAATTLQRRVWRRAARAPAGTALVHDLDAAASQIVRRASAWAPLSIEPGGDVLMVECEQGADRSALMPLTGKWIGAYAHTAQVSPGGREPVAESTSAGQLSVLAVQDGHRVLIRCASPDWQVTAEGLLVGDRFTAGGARTSAAGEVEETWFVEGNYERASDRMRGTVTTIGPDRTDRRTFFLQPVVPLPAP